MTVLPNGIAHVSFCRGATFLPARSPYDCETLIDHVTHAVRTQGRVQVLVHDQTWQVHLVTNFDSPATCSRCCQRLEAICHCSGETTATYCVRCAFAWHAQLTEYPRTQAPKSDVAGSGVG